MSTEADRGRTQRGRVAERLLAAIHDGKYEVGQRLPSERQLALEFAVSRPVIREALGMLSSLEVVNIQVGRGAFVLSADPVPPEAADPPHSLLEIIDVREVLESGALALGSRRASDADKASVRQALERLSMLVEQGSETTAADVDLHRAIIIAAGSPALRELWSTYETQIAATIRVSPHGRVMSTELLEQHARLAAGIIDGDLLGALDACRLNHEDNRRFLRTLIGG